MKMTDKKDEKNNSTTKETEKPEQLTDEKLENAAGGWGYYGIGGKYPPQKLPKMP